MKKLKHFEGTSFFSLHTTQQQIKGFIANLSQKYINPEL